MTVIKNEEKVKEIIKQMVTSSYEKIKGEKILLCLECCDVDLYVAAASYPEFEAAIKGNFELDAMGEIIDRKGYHQLMRELDEYFIQLHMDSGYYDFFPAGEYEVEGQLMESETDMLAPKDVFFAPFEFALRR